MLNLLRGKPGTHMEREREIEKLNQNHVPKRATIPNMGDHRYDSIIDPK
jgi:hypothetical protein